MSTPRRHNRDQALASFDPSWTQILESALADPAGVELNFLTSAARERIRGQFYNLRKAMLRERPDLWERYLDLGTFKRPAGPESFPLVVRRGSPDADLIRDALGDTSLACSTSRWPDPPAATEATAQQELSGTNLDPADALKRFLG